MSGSILNVTASTGTVWSVSNNTTIGSVSMITCGQQVQNYAWAGFDFLLYTIGIAILVGTACLAYEFYQQCIDKPATPTIVKRRK